MTVNWHIAISVPEIGKQTIHQITTMLAISKNVKFPGHNHLLTTGTYDSTHIIAQAPASHQY